MQCPSCQFELGEPRDVCPRCGRFIASANTEPTMAAPRLRRLEPATEMLLSAEPPLADTDEGLRPANTASDIPLAQFAVGGRTDPNLQRHPPTPAHASKIISKRAAQAAGFVSSSGTRRSPSTVGSSQPNPGAETRLDLALDPYIGHKIQGKYLIQELIAVGGMGKVYKARHTGLDRTVCIKTLKPSLLSDKTIVGRFEREAKAASKLTHPNAIQVFDFGDDGQGSLFLSMEYVSGRDLRSLLLKEHPLGEARIIHIVQQVLAALADAHSQGIVHRDLKPENIMVEARRGEPDFVKVLDFGIAKIMASDQPTLTMADRICGTPLYMAPEQATGGTVDARTDLYAVGVILYQLSTGVLPFFSQNTIEVLTKHVNERPTPPRLVSPELGITPALEALILKAMSKDPADRPQTADAFREELRAIAVTKRDEVSSPIAPARSLPPISKSLLRTSEEAAPPAPTSAHMAPAATPEVPPPAAAPREDEPLNEHDFAAIRPQSRSAYLVAGGLSLAIAVVAGLLIASPDKAPPPEEIVSAPVAATPAVAAPAIVVTCPADMVAAGSTCVDRLGFPNNPKLRPRGSITHVQAVAACAEHGKHLCSDAEWVDACAVVKPTNAEWTATPADPKKKTFMVRGLSTTPSRCASQKAMPAMTKVAGIGLRCCAPSKDSPTPPPAGAAPPPASAPAGPRASGTP